MASKKYDEICGGLKPLPLSKEKPIKKTVKKTKTTSKKVKRK